MLVCQILLLLCFRPKPYANGCNKVLGKYIIAQKCLEKLYFITLNYTSKYTLYPEHFEYMICTLKSSTMIIITLCTSTSSLLLTWIEKYKITWEALIVHLFNLLKKTKDKLNFIILNYTFNYTLYLELWIFV